MYFHEQGPDELRREVEEYIITGGYEAGDPRASTEGIHEQFVRLLTNMRAALRTSGGSDLPACWISGFYGSGKSSFAKLLGLALDGRTLAANKPLADALLEQDRSPNAPMFRRAWDDLVGGLSPMAVVFDLGAKAITGEQVHNVVVREVQKRLGYSSTSSVVADYELRFELEGIYGAFEAKVTEVHGKPWVQLKDSQLAEDYFSAALHALNPALYPDPMAWFLSRVGSPFEGKRAADDAVAAIEHMMEKRAKERTLFLVVDEVSQYVHDEGDRQLALQSFVSALGKRLRGRAWLLATGQQKLEEGGGGSITKLKDRFPPALRVHLGSSNIREVVYRRLLRKKKLLEVDVRDQFHAHRPDLALHAYQGDQISERDFVEIYPLLPGHVDLLLGITSGLRARGTRGQGDANEIRGLLQLLGDMFREQDLVRREVGWLVTVDRVYDILHTALSADLHLTLNRALDFCQQQGSEMMKRVVKAVAMLELVQDEKHPTTADRFARSLYAKLGQGSQLAEVQQALDALVAEGYVAHFAKTGYKIESSAGQEWQLDRDKYVPGADQISKEVQTTLADLLGDVDKINVQGLPLGWVALFSDDLGNQGTKDKHLVDERKPTALWVDFQLTKGEGADEWVPRSATPAYQHRIVWVAGPEDGLRTAATKLLRSKRKASQFDGRPPSDPDTARLLIEERNHADSAQRELAESVKAAFMAGQMYFKGRARAPRDEGSTFLTALNGFGTRIAGELYPNPVAYTVGEKDVLYLIENAELSAPPPVFGQDKLGLLAIDAGRYGITCSGRVPQELLAHVKENPSITGAALIAHFGGPPHGVSSDVVRATVVGLLRGGKVRIEIPGIAELTSVRDEGARELLKDSGLRRARFTENTLETLSPRDKNAICAFFKDQLGKDVARDNDAIADAATERFKAVRERLTALQEQFRKLPRGTAYPDALTKLDRALTSCTSRNAEPTVLALKRVLPALRDGITLLRRMESDLTDPAIAALHGAIDARTFEWPGLAAVGATEEARAAAEAIGAHVAVQSPWEDAAQLAPLVAALRSEYRAKQRAVLDAHAAEVGVATERLKRREGFDKLAAEQRHAVLQYLTEGTAPGTDERAIAPSLDGLEGQLAARREAAEHKALRKLDDLREGLRGSPVVEIALGLDGRELATEPELDRLLADVRARILKELAVPHRVRLKGS